MKNIPFLRQHNAVRICALPFAALFAVSATAANISWNGATDAVWNTAGNWVGGVAPVTTDVAVFDATSVANLSTTLGADFSIQGLRITTPGGLITIGAGNLLTLGSGGIDMSAASQNLLLNALVALGANQSWNVTNGRTLTANGVISGTNVNLNKIGLGDLILGGANTFTGTTTIGGGTLTLNGSLNGTTGTDLTFAGTGIFNVSAASGVSQGMKVLRFSGGDGTVRSTNNGGTSTVSFTSRAARTAGATGNFTLINGTQGAGGTNNITIGGGEFTAQLLDRGLFYNGSQYAAYDAGGFVRGLIYGTDTNALTTIPGGTTLGVNDVTQNVEISGNITTQTTASVNTIRVPGAFNIALDVSQTLSLNGILKSGGNASTISGGTGITTTAANNEMVIRTDLPTDSLAINTPILANGVNQLTKSGSGTLIIGNTANTYTGLTTVAGGTLRYSASDILSTAAANGGVVLTGGSIVIDDGVSLFNGKYTFNTSGTINKTGTTGKIENNNEKIDVSVDAGVTASIGANMTWTGNFDQTEGIRFNNQGNLTLTGAWTSADGNQKNVITLNGGGTMTIATGASINNRYTGGNAQPNWTWIGNTSANNILNINGRWLTHTFQVGASTFGGNIVNVNGPGNSGTPTLVSNGNNIQNVWGGSSSNNQVNINAGAWLNTDRSAGSNVIQIGRFANANNNSVTVNGAGAGWTTSTEIRVGDAGDFNSLTISNGGTLNYQRIFVGGTTGSSNTATVSGTGSTATSDNSGNSWVEVGHSGSSNTLQVTNGGALSMRTTGSGRDLSVGLNVGANLNKILVTGNNSLLTTKGTATNALAIGGRAVTSLSDGGTGNHLDIYSDGTADIQNGVALLGASSALNLGNGIGISTIKVGQSTIAPGIVLGISTSTLPTININSGRITATAAGSLISGASAGAAVTLNGSAYINTDAFANSINIGIGGTGTVTKEGVGTLTLTATNTYLGSTVVSAGVLQVGNGGTAGSLGAGSVTNNTSLVFNRSDALSVSSVISGGGTLAQIGGGTLTLSGTNTYTGATTLTAGALSVGVDANLGGANTLIFDGGALQITGTVLNNFGSHTASFNAGKTVALDVNDAGNTFTVSQPLNQLTGGLTKLGGGKLILTSGNTYTGLTTVSGGTL